MRTYHPKADRHDPLLRVLSLGAGKQSTALLLLGLRGEVAPYDAVIFADTQWEPEAVYRHLEKLAAMCDEAGVPLHVPTAGDIRADALDDRGFASMPVFMPDQKRGGEVMGARQCTYNYKLKPIANTIRELVAERLGIDAPTWRQVPKDVRVEVVKGISVDEVRRAKPPRERWQIVHYPLLELRWRRDDCVRYLEGLGIDAPRSACIGCPYRRNEEWRDLPAHEWQDAVDFDAAIRDRADGGAYLHRSLLPLHQVDLSTAADHGQLELDGFTDECEGICGL